MAKEFRLPDIGEGLAEGEIVRWLVDVGGTVAADQPVVEIETDKAVVEIPSPFAGVVLHHGGAEGEMVEVGAILVVVGEQGEVWSDRDTSADVPPIVGTLAAQADELQNLVPQPAHTEATPSRPSVLPAVRKLAGQLGVDLTAVTPSGPGGRISREDVTAHAALPTADAARPAVGPLVRRLAAELGVDLGAVNGSGPGGRITREDVTRSAEVPAVDGDERRPMSRLRKTIAARVSRSWTEIPQVTAFDQVDATRMLAVRRAMQDRHGVPVPIDAVVVAAVLPALREYPEFNASLDGDEVVLHRRRDIGVAVTGADGLLVAVVRDAGSLGLLELAAEIRRLGDAGRQRALTIDELSGQTFTVSNIGAIGGGGHGTPIVPVGTVGILSVGRAVDTPVARGGDVVVAPVMPLSLSYDHRLIDGAEGRRFLANVVENLAEPALFLA